MRFSLTCGKHSIPLRISSAAGVGYSGYCGLPILEGNEMPIMIHTAVITVDLITVERATLHSDKDDNFYFKVLTSFFHLKNTQRIKHICAY